MGTSLIAPSFIRIAVQKDQGLSQAHLLVRLLGSLSQERDCNSAGFVLAMWSLDDLSLTPTAHLQPVTMVSRCRRQDRVPFPPAVWKWPFSQNPTYTAYEEFSSLSS